MTTHQANAFPTKRFFLEMFTRDISLEDCILDLIDNSIDALVRSKNVDFVESIFNRNGKLSKEQKSHLPKVTVSFSERLFTIEDNCGGISRKEAREDAFNFGHDEEHGAEEGRRQLGAYGIGLKRALFKIGEEFEIISKTRDEGFSATLNVSEWSRKDDGLNDWRIPIEYVGGAHTAKSAGTKITIHKLRPETRMVFLDETFESRLYKAIAQTYALFLERYIRVYLKEKVVLPLDIPIGTSDQVGIAHEQFEENEVKVKIFAGVAAKDASDSWRAESAGWYVLCNGRVVVPANKSELTGWGAELLPAFHSKYRPFVGLAFFQSEHPLRLPWTTTKRSLNRESPIYQKARTTMASIARPVLSFLDRMYPGDIPEQPQERRMAESVKPTDVVSVAATPDTVFKVKPSARFSSDIVRIQYGVPREEVEKVR